MMNELLNDGTLRFRVTRRTVLGGVIGGGIVATISIWGNPSPAMAAGASASFEASADSMYIPLPDEKVLILPRLLGGTITVGAGGAPKGLVLEASWDPRLYDVEKPLLFSGSSEVGIREIGRPRDSGDGRRHWTVKTSEALPAGSDYVLMLGTGKTLTYPRDVISDPKQTRISLQDSAKSSAKNVQPTEQTVDSSAVWGAILGASWKPETWGNGYRTWRPELVTLRSVGPNPIPAGTIIRMQLDKRLFDGLSLDRESKPSSPGHGLVSGGNQSGVAWPLPAALAAGGRISLNASARFIRFEGSLPTLQAPTVSVQPARRSIGQRCTGQETLTRTDNICTEADVTRSRPL